MMAWQRIGNKPLSEPMLTRFTDIYATLGEIQITTATSGGVVFGFPKHVYGPPEPDCFRDSPVLRLLGQGILDVLFTKAKVHCLDHNCNPTFLISLHECVCLLHLKVNMVLKARDCMLHSHCYDSSCPLTMEIIMPVKGTMLATLTPLISTCLNLTK